jgi:DNA recombination-mediator protein A
VRFFPERNVTMSALTEATVIVEAGQTSGTLTQARAALHQGRKKGGSTRPILRLGSLEKQAVICLIV